MYSNLKALGLNTSPNQLSAGEGSMVEASNIIIRRDNVIESRRGFKLYGNSFGTSTDRAKQLMEYKDRIIRHYGTTLQFDNGSSNFQSFAGSYSEVEPGLRIKSVQANRNLYFTTSEGIQKISAKTADEFTTAANYITLAGGLKALDITSRLSVTLGDQSGFLPQDSAVAYRQVWGKHDANNNLVLGTPSQRTEVFNPAGPLIVGDLNRILVALDDITQTTSTAFISNNDYAASLELPNNASAQEIQTNLIVLASKIDTDILYGTNLAGPLTIASAAITGGVCTITFSLGNPTNYLQSGSHIFLTGFAVTGTGSIAGAQVVSSVTSTTLTFNTTATGTVSVTSSSINSNEFRFIKDNVEYNAASFDLDSLLISTPATADQLNILQTALELYLFKLQSLPDLVVSASNKTTYLDPIAMTTTASVIIRFTLPQNLTSADFYQIYRSSIAQATGTAALDDITPSDELQLVFEGFPTSAEISQGFVELTDVTPDAFRGANLYTNASTGEGILQSNDSPPWAKDINSYKGYIFFANTRTKHTELISLLGVSSMITEYNGGTIPTLTIATATTSHTYRFVVGKYEQFNLTTPTKASVPSSGYFDVNSANNEILYRFWYDKTGSDVAPTAGGRALVKILILNEVTALQVADKTRDVIAQYSRDFVATPAVGTPIITVIATQEGYTTDPVLGPGMAAAGFAVVVTQQGQGEDASIGQVLLSSAVSPAIAVDQTAKSLVHVINETSGEIVNAFYLSGANDVPGKFQLEAKNLDDTPFYIVANNTTTGASFNPDFSPAHLISGNTLANPTVVTSSDPHGLLNGDQIIITNSNSTPSINGIHTITWISTTQFSIPVNVTIAGTRGAFSSLDDAQVSDNQRNSNRVYYSKFQQPEAVPAVNFLDIGSTDKAIHRIFPLRDSLFVFKEDGLWRISGEVAPFTVALFDSSCNLVAPDSVDVCNNLIFGWTTQGIQTVSEAGVDIASRAIDNIILQISSSNYMNFTTVTWGVGYDSDNAYYIYTNSDTEDSEATIAFRYNTLTSTWTTIDKTNTCGMVLDSQDMLYMGAGDTNFLEQERKTFTRLDYADRELSSVIVNNAIRTPSNSLLTLSLPSISNLVVGDVIVQEQIVTIFDFNMLLKKLDIDQGVADSNYYSTLKMVTGDNLRAKIVALATKLDADTGVADNTFLAAINSYTGSITSNTAADPTIVTTSAAHNLFTGREIVISGVTGSSPTINGTHVVTVTGGSTFSVPVGVIVAGTGGSFLTNVESFTDVQACYNKIIVKLNADSTVEFSNYMQITNTTTVETIILKINTFTNSVDLNLALPYVVGPIIIYKAIKTRFKYTPLTFGDPLMLKHMREATIMFDTKAFTQAKMFFASDLLFQERPVPFRGDGNGIFGNVVNFGTGNYFGGTSHASPFRTYVPRECQRCRYLTVGFEHQIAREKYSIFGITVTGESSESTRAYR